MVYIWKRMDVVPVEYGKLSQMYHLVMCFFSLFLGLLTGGMLCCVGLLFYLCGLVFGPILGPIKHLRIKSSDWLILDQTDVLYNSYGHLKVVLLVIWFNILSLYSYIGSIFKEMYQGVSKEVVFYTCGIYEKSHLIRRIRVR